MKEPIFRNDMTVRLVDRMGDDKSIVRAARVSTGTDGRRTYCPDCMDGLYGCAACHGSNLPQDEQGLIGFLMKNRHGSPFEQTAITYYIETPIFVAREFMRHRVASYNETSGRYREMEPVFYVPSRERNLVQVGKAGAYKFVPGDEDQYEATRASLSYMATEGYGEYVHLLGHGVAKEVARMVLPLNLYTSFYVTMNVRGLLNFLSLRTKREDSVFPSFPQREIEMVADDMERIFRDLFPITALAFDAAGRVCP